MTLEQLKTQIKSHIDQLDDPRLLHALGAIVQNLKVSASTQGASESEDFQVYGDAIFPASSESSSHYQKPNLNSEGDKAA